MTELKKLCDKVPSFPDDVAMALIEEELGKPWHEVYSELSPSPIAAASLGQVYKGRLKENGDLVAVKVQRPFVLETVTVDLFVIRNLGLFLRKFPQVSVDVVGLVDEWAARFFEELDYVNEGENGTYFAEMMKKDLPQVVVPKTYQNYTSRKVLTTQWIDGEKLSQSGVFDAERFIDVMQAFETFITAAKSGGGEDMNGGMAELALLQKQTSSLVPTFPASASQPNQPAETRVALSFLLSEKGNFFREFLLDEIVKGIDAITREQLVQAMAVFGFRNATPIFCMVPTLGPFRPAALVPSVTEEDKVILNNVQKVIEFLTARSSMSNNPDQVVDVSQVVRELLPVLPGISATVLPEIISRLGSRVMARIVRDTFL